MAIDIKLLKKRGISAGEYKKIFTNKKKPARVQKLIDLISSRLKDGFKRNLTEYKTFAAIDLAYDAPFAQTTPTFIEHLLSRKLTAEEMLKEVEKMGLREEDLFLSVEMPNGTIQKIVNPPVFYKVLVPAVRAYCTARTSALFNPRNKSPLLPFHPLRKTSRNRVICEIWTDLVQQISSWYGYPAYLDQAIKQMVKYGVSLAFPCEEWHSEKQMKLDDKGNEQVVTEREGIRYLFPHPTRMFYDLYHPAPTLNTGTGCMFAAHWQIQAFSEILDNRKYWNRSAISFGTNWFTSPLAGNYFTEFFPCRINFPVVTTGEDAKREDKASFYSSNDRDKSVFLTHMFMLITPKDFGLGRYEDDVLVSTYSYPVWHHFILAGDETVIWAEPCAYIPNTFMGYDYDAQNGRQSSLGLEMIPWQDHLGNIITQNLLTAKQNLANVIFYDKNVVDVTDVEKIKNLGEKKYRSLNFLAFDGMKNSRVGVNVEKAFIPVQLTYRTIQDGIQMMGAVLDIMERVLQFTAQEVGATAKHYQSAEEVKITNESSDSRIVYTGSSVDAAMDAWKMQILTAAMAYKDDDVTVEISADIPDVEKIIKEIGFTIVSQTDERIIIKGKKTDVPLTEFAKTGEGQEQDTDGQTAQIMFQTIGMVANNPALFQSIGSKNLIGLIEQASHIAGADKDFKIPLTSKPEPMPEQEPQPGQSGQPTQPEQPAAQGQPPAPDIQSQIGPLLQQVQASILQIVQEKIAKPAAVEMVKQEKQIQQLEQIVAQLAQLLKGAQPPAAAPTPEPTAILPAPGQA